MLARFVRLAAGRPVSFSAMSSAGMGMFSNSKSMFFSVMCFAMRSGKNTLRRAKALSLSNVSRYLCMCFFLMAPLARILLFRASPHLSALLGLGAALTSALCFARSTLSAKSVAKASPRRLRRLSRHTSYCSSLSCFIAFSVLVIWKPFCTAEQLLQLIIRAEETVTLTSVGVHTGCSPKHVCGEHARLSPEHLDKVHADKVQCEHGEALTL